MARPTIMEVVAVQYASRIPITTSEGVISETIAMSLVAFTLMCAAVLPLHGNNRATPLLLPQPFAGSCLDKTQQTA